MDHQGRLSVQRDRIDGLEVLVCRPDGGVRTARPPILMVHGVCLGAWCWESTFLPFFASRGWDSYAVTLRGHHADADADDVRGSTIANYVDDVRTVAQSFSTPPIVIGHSMGGMVVQSYLQDHPAPAAVLLASMPPRGALRSPALRRHPFLLLRGVAKRNVRTLFSTPERCRTLFFSRHSPDDVVVQCASRVTEESNRAVLGLLDRRMRRRPMSGTTRMLVVGARDDAIFSARQVERTAAFYGADTFILSGTGHNLMMEARWCEAADHIESWLRRSLT